METRKRQYVVIGAALLAAIAYAAPGQRANIAIDMHRPADRDPYRLQAQLALGGFAIDFRLTWSARA